MDEFEAIGLSRQKDNISEVGSSTVTTLLQMLDGFSSNNGLLLIAATNTPYDLDGAILSRCNEKIEIPLPSFDVIKNTLIRKLGKFSDDTDDFDFISKKLDGYSNRDVKNLINKVLDIYSIEHRKEENKNKRTDEFKINIEIIKKAFEKIKSSIKKDEVKKLQEYKLSLE